MIAWLAKEMNDELKAITAFLKNFFLKDAGSSASSTLSQHFLLLDYFHLCYGKTASFPSFTLDK